MLQMRSIFFKKCIYLFSFFSSLCAMHNSNRYFLFLERPSVQKNYYKGSLTPSFFMTSACEAYVEREQKVGIGEIWGTYNLNTLFNDVSRVLGSSFVNPFTQEGKSEWQTKNILYSIKGGLHSQGFSLNYKQHIAPALYANFFIPFMKIVSHHSFVLKDPTTITGTALSEEDLTTLDRIRRSLHDQYQLDAADFSQWTIGDFDFSLHWNHSWDHKLLTRNIYLKVCAGAVLPTGTRRDHYNPAAISAMGDGHLATYLESTCEAELKHNLFLGLTLGIQNEYAKRHHERIPINSQDFPFLYSPIIGEVRVSPGATYKFAPYIILANISDGLDFQVGWSYIHHSQNKFYDMRVQPEQDAIPSYFENIQRHSRFRAGIVDVGFYYDSTRAFRKWTLQPKIIGRYEAVLGTPKNIPAFQRFTFGVELCF